MKSDRQIKLLAKKIFELCLKDNQVDEATLARLTEPLLKSKENVAKKILINISVLLQYWERQNTLIVESTTKLDTNNLTKIKDHFEKQVKRKLNLKFSLNEALISGLKITLNDFVWEKSIRSNLENMKGAIYHE